MTEPRPAPIRARARITATETVHPGLVAMSHRVPIPALGPLGLALGWTPLVKNQVRKQAAAQLDRFRRRGGFPVAGGCGEETPPASEASPHSCDSVALSQRSAWRGWRVSPTTVSNSDLRASRSI